jgi:hypothetical protein
MTAQALAWTLDQPVPGTAKLVLIGLGNHADHTTGFVHFDAPTVAALAVIGVPSLWRYLGALERNGFLAKDDRKSADGDRRDYWLMLDRDPALPWSWSAQETQDDASADDEPQDVEVADSVVPPPKPSAPSAAPNAFRRDRQDKARNEIKAAEPVPPAGQFPVIEGSKAFEAWTKHLREHKRVMPFTQAVLADGKYRRGVYMPSLFPPAEQNQKMEEVDL